MDANTLIKQLQTMGLKPRPYSGRGMHGKECIGVSVERIGEHQFPTPWRSESLGKGQIVYWPTATWPEGA